METDKHYLMVGSFVLLMLVAIAIFSTWLLGVQDNSKYMRYRIHFAESVSGLDVGSPVKFRGVPVGKVKTLAIDSVDTRLIQVDIDILKTTPVKTDTVAMLKLQGITGAIYIELSGGSVDAENLIIGKEYTQENPPEISSEPSTLNTLMDTLPIIAEKLSHVADQVDKLFSDKNIATFSDTLKNMRKTSRNADELTKSLKDDPSQLIFSHMFHKKRKEDSDQ